MLDHVKIPVKDFDESRKFYEEVLGTLGAKVVMPHQALPGGDEMAVVVDPDGIPFGLFKSDKK